jgi:hypothetical protein
MLPVGFVPAIPASERRQTYALDRAATGIGQPYVTALITEHLPKDSPFSSLQSAPLA